jgi:Glycogen recognition site of AMP-activated protein kinase
MCPDPDACPPDDPLITALAARLRAPVPLSPRVESAVLAQLRADRQRWHQPPWHQPPWRRLAGGAALAAGAAATFALGVAVGRRSPTAGDVASRSRSVEFVLRAAADSSVALIGDFNDWDPRMTPLRRDAGGTWAVTIPLRPGRYRYTFIVDGTRWRPDPTAPRAIGDDFGAPTSVITIARR